MASFLVVAAQPTLDHTVVIPEISIGKTHRVEKAIILPSGKALNVARSLRILGAQVRVAALLAGHNGEWISESLKEFGVSIQAIWMKGENRIAYSIYNPIQDNLTEFIEDIDGPVRKKEWNKLVQLVQKMLPEVSILILSGRAPKGVPDHGYKSLVEMAHAACVPVLMDCYGPLLEQALPSHPTMIKINHREVKSILGVVPQTLYECIESARQICSLGVPFSIITLGKIGAVAVGLEEAWLAEPPKVKGASIGSGDAMMAGVAFALSQKLPLREALRLGVSVGAANVLIAGAGLFRLEDVERIKEQVLLTPLV